MRSNLLLLGYLFGYVATPTYLLVVSLKTSFLIVYGDEVGTVRVVYPVRFQYLDTSVL